MANNFYRIKNGITLPTLDNDPTITPPTGSVPGDAAFYNGELYLRTVLNWEKVVSGQATDAELADGAVTEAKLASDAVTNVKVSASAAIAGTKINPNFGNQNVSTTGSISGGSATLSELNTAGVVHNSAAGALTTSLIVDADVDAAAAISGSKIAPNFGSQNILTTGTLTTGEGTINGDLTVTGTLTETSSVRYKTNLKPITCALETVTNLQGMVYDRKDGSRCNEIGLIAEEVYKHIPHAVKQNADGGVDGVEYTRIVPFLIEAIKDLKKELEELKNGKSS